MTGFCFHHLSWEYAGTDAFFSGETSVTDCLDCGATIEVRL